MYIHWSKRPYSSVAVHSGTVRQPIHASPCTNVHEDAVLHILVNLQDKHRVRKTIRIH